jgi:hypothetical protein
MQYFSFDEERQTPPGKIERTAAGQGRKPFASDHASPKFGPNGRGDSKTP